MADKARIAHLSGMTATIQNSPPLVTSNKARAKYGLDPRNDSNGAPPRFDALRPQRLAAPVTVYVEQFSAHPLESDAAELYGPPDGYVDAAGTFHRERQSPGDTPVYEVVLQPDDGLYPLPYMARQADGSAWESECAFPGAPAEQARQTFFPDGSRSFEEIDRLGIGGKGLANLISSYADVSFFRLAPPGGYTKGSRPERRGVDFFAYYPPHLRSSAPRPRLAHITNAVHDILGSGKFDGAIWTEGSPSVEETLYWLNLLIDTTLPICGNAAQRPQGIISNDGPKNIVDSVTYIASRVWADEQGRNRAGAVVIQEQRVFAARNVQKGDARPGGYVATGGHGGIIGAVGHDGPPVLTYLPTALHTYCSEVNRTRLPRTVTGVRRTANGIATAPVAIKDDAGRLLETAIPKVAITKEVVYGSDDGEVAPEREVDLIALLDSMLTSAPLAGFVIEGQAPYGTSPSVARGRVLERALYSGLPVVCTGRGNAEGFTPGRPPFIAGSNLTSTKARLLLMAALMKLGALPPATDPDRPTPAEVKATAAKVAEYQALFDRH